MDIERKRHRHNFVSIAPLVDIVFLLLLFFMLTSQIINEAGIKITLPESETALAGQEDSVVVSITDKGEIYLMDKRVEIDSLTDEIRNIVRNTDNGLVQIRADKKTDVGLLIKVLDRVRLAGVRNYTILTERL